MTSKAKLGENIVEGLISIRGASALEIIGQDDFKLPRLIASGTGGSIQVSQDVDEAISALAARLKSDRPTLSKTVRQAEWRTWVREAVGPVIARVDLSRPSAETGPELVAEVETALDGVLAGLVRREHAFGATIFSNGDIPRFDLGPVSIEPTLTWLGRKESEGEVTTATARRVRAVLNGKRVRKRPSGVDQLREDNILDVIRGCPYVVSVRIVGYGAGASLEVAATAARLALTTVALLWKDSTDALQGFRLQYDGPIHRRIALTFVPGRIILAGSTLRGRPWGPRIEVSDWLQELSQAASVFSAAGEAIAFLTSPDEQAPRRALMNGLLQAMLWFNAGCRDESGAHAVVNFSACLDALGGGKKAGGILRLLEARFGIAESDPIHPGGPTFKASVHRVYDDGRSRTVHGTSVKIGHDWTETRVLAEQLARLALLQCLDLAGTDSTCLTVADLLRTRAAPAGATP